MPASSAPCSMAVRHGLHMPVRRKGSTLSTLEAYDAYSASHGKTRWPTLVSSLVLAPHHVHPAETMSAALAWPCLPYGGWPNSKGHPLQRAYLRAEKHWPPAAEVQGCMQERHEGARHQHQFLRGPCCWPHQLEKHASQTAADQQREADSSSSREASLQKGNGSQQTRVNAQMQPMWLRLPLSHWSLQPWEALLKPSRRPGQVTDGLSSSMVSHDWQRPTN